MVVVNAFYQLALSKQCRFANTARYAEVATFGLAYAVDYTAHYCDFDVFTHVLAQLFHFACNLLYVDIGPCASRTSDNLRIRLAIFVARLEYLYARLNLFDGVVGE